MQLRFLVPQLRLGALPARLLLRDPGTTLGLLSLALTRLGLSAMLADDLLTPLSQLELALLDARALTKPRQQEEQAKQHQRRNDDDHDDRNDGHALLLVIRLFFS